MRLFIVYEASPLSIWYIFSCVIYSGFTRTIWSFNVTLILKIIDYLSNVSIELIYKIYDNVSSFEIFVCLYVVNKWFRLLSLNYTHFLFDFTYFKKKKHFDFFLHSSIIDIIFFRFSDILKYIWWSDSYQDWILFKYMCSLKRASNFPVCHYWYPEKFLLFTHQYVFRSK